jgi:exodeoxyribonuclease VII small subunit
MNDQSTPREDILPENWRYEETVAEVEAIIARIESGEMDLADVFDQFEQAVQYIQQCETFLNNRQHQMELLIETLEDTTD